jgi:hypothetical protein
MLKVCNVAENSFVFTLKNGTHAIIAGKNRAPEGALFAKTIISESDWEAINGEYGHMSEIKRGIIFVEKTDHKAFDRAVDPETQAIDTGTKQATPAEIKRNSVVKDPYDKVKVG